MSNCLTKITNVFRRKQIKNRSNRNSLNEEEYLPQCQNCEGDNHNNNNIVYQTIIYAIEAHDNDKQPCNLNKYDNDIGKNNNETENVISHQEISLNNTFVKEKSIKSISMKECSSASTELKIERDYLAPKSCKTQSISKNILLPPQESSNSQNIETNVKEPNEISLLDKKLHSHFAPQIQDEQKNERNSQISLAVNDDSNEVDRNVYIQEYESFAKTNRNSLIGSPPAFSLPRYMELFPNTAPRQQSTLNNCTNNNCSIARNKLHMTEVDTLNLQNKEANEEGPVVVNTPEEIKYGAKVATENKNVMTPLSTDTSITVKTLQQQPSVQPEVIKAICSLDNNTLPINNLTFDDKIEQLRQFENKTQQRSNSNIGPETCSSDLYIDNVVLRGTYQINQSDLSLYERRQPKCPKLKLILENKKKIIKKNDTHIERNTSEVKYPTVLPPNPNLKALLIFHKVDNICEVIQQACNRQHLEVRLVKSKESAIDSLCSTTESFQIVIVDARNPKHLDAEHIARSIRHMSGHHFSTIIAVVKKSISERDDVLNALLDAGVNRCVAESTNLSMCTMELKQTLHSIVRPYNVISTQQALYTALHRLKEVLIITDDLLRIQYANRSAERLLSMRLDEVINKPLADIFISDVSSINQNSGKGIREFDGILTVKRKNQDGIPMHVRVVPVACIGRLPTHFVFNFDVPGGQTDFIASLPQPKEAPRGSLHSIRRGSFDVRSIASDGLRRTSLAKLTSLPLEAPITKIINLLSQVQENCSADEVRLIDKVMEFLKREGLYSPQMKEIRPDDPIATDLIGALLTGPNIYSSRRSSNDSIVKSSRPCNSSNTPGLMPAKMKATPLIMEILEESLNWEFNIFKLEEVTERRPLLYLGMEIFRRFDVFSTLGVDETVCKNWLALMESHYHSDNTYHNSTHAADVMQATGVFISQLAAKNLVMDCLEEATALIAAAAHDVDHPGRSSSFLCNSNSPLAILYNDLTVLESHHASTTFRLALADDKVNIFKNLDRDTYKLARSTIIDMILATEMTRHFEHLAKFVSVFGAEVEPRDIVQTEEESSILMRRMLIKVADVSNPTRPVLCCIEWARRIAEEYFTQTDEEKLKDLPIVMPMFDRAICSIPKSQIGFIEYIIQDMIHAWDSFIDMPELITYMQMNYSQWKKFEEQGIHTLAQVKDKQISLASKKSSIK